MENLIKRDGYDDAKRRVKEFYARIGSVWCPASNDYVSFKSAGLRHLIRKGKMPRPERDQMRRFFSLKVCGERIG